MYDESERRASGGKTRCLMSKMNQGCDACAIYRVTVKLLSPTRQLGLGDGVPPSLIPKAVTFYKHTNHKTEVSVIPLPICLL